MRVGKTPGRTNKLASCLLTASMILGFPGPAAVQGATATPTAASAAGALSVETDPVGATVLVDGQSWGTTPLALRAIAPGDHRVRVVKQGYLDNSRLVSIQAGQAGRVQVKLTPHGQHDAVRAQVDTTTPPKKEGGGSKKALLIGAGLVAIGAGVYLATKSSNKAPVVGSVVVSPSTALQGGTSVNFTAQGASDPGNDTLTYDWNFGDGSTGSGATTTHTYTTAGTMAATVTVKDPKGLSASASGTVTVRSLTGTWRGSLLGVAVVAQLTHSGSAVTGAATLADAPATVSGSVRAPLGVTLTVTIPGFIPFTYTANTDAGINTMSGSLQGSGFTGETLTLTRQ